jgi:hypothetical protein
MAQDADQDRPDRLPGGLRSLIRYRVDNLLSRGTWAVLLWLAGVTTMVVLASSAIMAIFRVTFSGGGDRSWGRTPGKACCGRSTPEPWRPTSVGGRGRLR